MAPARRKTLTLASPPAVAVAYAAYWHNRAKHSRRYPLCMGGDRAIGDTPGRTALSYAAEPGSPEMVRLVLDVAAIWPAPTAARRIMSRTAPAMQPSPPKSPRC